MNYLHSHQHDLGLSAGGPNSFPVHTSLSVVDFNHPTSRSRTGHVIFQPINCGSVRVLDHGFDDELDHLLVVGLKVLQTVFADEARSTARLPAKSPSLCDQDYLHRHPLSFCYHLDLNLPLSQPLCASGANTLPEKTVFLPFRARISTPVQQELDG